jgi:hypothetical protein
VSSTIHEADDDSVRTNCHAENYGLAIPPLGLLLISEVAGEKSSSIETALSDGPWPTGRCW